MLDIRSRRADIRKCAVIAAVVSACCVVALEFAGGSLAGAYSGLDGKLGPRSTADVPHQGAPASTPPR